MTAVNLPSGTPSVTITNRTKSTGCTFTAPAEAANLEFRLIVTDGNGAKAADTVTVNVVNRAPVVFAGYNQVVPIHTEVQASTVQLDGSTSDPDPTDRNRLRIKWTQREGEEVTLLSSTQILNPTFRAPTTKQDLVFRLTATDPYGVKTFDDVRIRVHDWITTSEWLDTKDFVGCGSSRRQKQIRLESGVVIPQYVAAPEEERWGEWADTSDVRPPTYSEWEDVMPLETRGEGADREKKVQRTVTWEKKISRTNHCLRTEYDWVTVTKILSDWVAYPEIAPPTPTADQWDVRYLNNKIQVKVTEIPEVIPAISEVRAKLGISPLGTGLGSDTITVTKNIGTTLNQWVDVLTSADIDWQTGTWTAQIRFENTIGDPVYSLGKLVTVPSPNRPPKAFAGYNDIVLPNTTVYLRGSSEDPDRHLATDMAYNWSLVEDVTETPG